MREAPRIEDLGVIGDGRSMALVSKGGAIDWLCWPRFDSVPVFDALLDPERGGRLLLRPKGDVPAPAWRYLDGTVVLETRWSAPEFELVVHDFMPALEESRKAARLSPDQSLFRVARCVRGEVDVVVEASFSAAFAGREPRVELDAFGARITWDGAVLRVRGTMPLERDGERGVAGLAHLKAGEVARIALARVPEAPAVLPPVNEAVDTLLDETAATWRAWSARARYDGPWRDLVVRSALTLKLLQYAPSGAIVAAPTTSLPERIGGDLNWDYRFCWLRDAALTAQGLFGLGYVEEGRAFASWLLHATREDQPRLRVLYDVFGRKPKPERVIDVPGFQGSRPVRVGNAADDQLQLDVYGEVVLATLELVENDGNLDGDTRKMLRRMGAWLCEHGEEPDAGIWEDRGPRRPHTHARAMVFAALDGLLRLEERGILKHVDAPRLRTHRDRVARAVKDQGFDEGIGSYTKLLGGNTVDASLLLLPLTGVDDAASPRMKSTVARIVERLSPRPGIVFRTESSRGHEGAFVACGFWLSDVLARMGEVDAAIAHFEGAAATANDLGLFAEETDVVDGALLGNFPQGFSHVGLIHAALTLERARAASPAGGGSS